MGNILSDFNERDTERDGEDLDENEPVEKNTRQSRANNDESSGRDSSSKGKTRRRRGPNVKTKSKANRRY